MLGNHNLPGYRGGGVPYVGKPGKHSEELPPERVTLRATQSRSQRKAAKPTMPKTPWD